MVVVVMMWVDGLVSMGHDRHDRRGDVRCVYVVAWRTDSLAVKSAKASALLPLVVWYLHGGWVDIWSGVVWSGVRIWQEWQKGGKAGER